MPKQKLKEETFAEEHCTEVGEVINVNVRYWKLKKDNNKSIDKSLTFCRDFEKREKGRGDKELRKET